MTARNARLRRDSRFLADRLLFWMPEGTTVEALAEELSALSEEKYWEIYEKTFKANTTASIVTAALTLAQEGWFVDLEVPPRVALYWARLSPDYPSDGPLFSIEDYYQQRRAAIEANLVATYPQRARFLQSAFRAHDAKDYAASVVLFLVQADGISHDSFGGELYRNPSKSISVQHKLKQRTGDWVWDAALAPLRAALPLALSALPGPGKFNRHLILHGKSLDYATRENSLRGISLVSYLQAMAEYERQHQLGARRP